MKKCKFQHGDVIFLKIDKIPEGYKKIEINENFVVEKGEGFNTHVLNKVNGCVAYKNDFGNLLLEIKNLPETKMPYLDHEEHGIKKFMPGIYVKEIENEYDAEKDEAFKTQD
jgi:hypothetical protein